MKKIKLIFLILLFIGITKANAQTWTQIGQDIDGEAANDFSGWSVSLSSDASTVAVGSFGNDGNGIDAGHVRIYQNNSGTWTQIGSDIEGEAAGDHSGRSISLSSDGLILAVGADTNNGNGTEAGHVRIFQNISGIWTQIGNDIEGEAAGDFSGGSVSLSSDGSILAVGAMGNDGNGNFSGHVRIFQNNSGTWSQIGSDIDGEAAEDRFGRSVSLSSDGSTVAVGANYNSGNGTDAGHVRVFQNNSGTWSQIGSDIDGEAAGDFSGWSVSLSSDASTVAVGAFLNDGNGFDAGHVRIYQNNSGTWEQIGADIDGEAEYDQSGKSVNLNSDGSTVAVGAIGNDGNGPEAGHVRIYRNNAGTWEQIGNDINGEAEYNLSGCSVSLSSDASSLVVGANGNSDAAPSAGHARVYENPFAGISDISTSGISIYPNPTSGIFKIDFQTFAGPGNIKITDITGKTIYNNQYTVVNKKLSVLHTLDLSSFENGIYIISIQTDKEIFTSKIVKE